MAADETAVVNRPKRVRTGNLPHLIHPNVSFFFFFFFGPWLKIVALPATLNNELTDHCFTCRMV